MRRNCSVVVVRSAPADGTKDAIAKLTDVAKDAVKDAAKEPDLAAAKENAAAATLFAEDALKPAEAVNGAPANATPYLATPFSSGRISQSMEGEQMRAPPQLRVLAGKGLWCWRM